MFRMKPSSSTFLTWLSVQHRGKSLVLLVFASTITAALVAHLFCWMNTLFGHDSLLIVQMDQAKEIALGRPFQHIYLYFRGLIVAPWLIGIVGTTFLALSNLVICRTLDIHSRGFIIAFCCIMTTSPFLTLLNATYITWYDVYMLALLLSCIAALLCKSYRYGWIPGAVLVCLSMGLYSAYLQVTIILLAGICLVGLLRNKSKLHFSFYARAIGMIIAGVLLYLLAAKGAQIFSNISESTSYNSLTSAFQFSGAFIQELAHAWLSPPLYLLFPETHMVRASGLANLILMAILIITVIRLCGKNRLQKHQVALVALITGLMPLFSNVVGLAAANNTHSLMIYSYYLFYGILLACLEITNRPPAPAAQHSNNDKKRLRYGFGNVVKTISILLVLLLSVSNTIYANQIYLKKELEYQSTLSIMTGFSERLESIPDYIPGKTPVVFYGSFADSPYYSGIRKGFPPSSDQLPFDDQGNFTKYSVGLGADISLYGPEQVKRYYDFILGRPIKIVEYANLDDSRKARFGSMPVYPLDGSIVFDKDVVLIRLS